jgi:hypothetical protein
MPMRSRNSLVPAAQRCIPTPLVALDAACATTLAGLGVGHTLLTPFFARRQPRLQQLWFAGSGLALVLLGLLNLARTRAGDPTVRRLCQLANPVGTLYLALLVRDLPEPPAYAALGLSAALTGLSLRPYEAAANLRDS